MKKYEYKIIEANYLPVVEELNRAGKEGWELCSIYRHEGSEQPVMFYVYKRELNTNSGI